MMKAVVFLCMLLASIAADNLTDKAYDAYRAKHYKEAFDLYKKGAQEGDIKATYNLGVMYEKGLGTKRDLREAGTQYGLVVMALEDAGSLKDPAICRNNMLPYYYKAMRKLAKMEKDEKYTEMYNRLKTLCSGSHTDPYFRKCPAAKIIRREDRYDLANFECRFYKKYPQIMRKLLALHSKYRQLQIRFEPKSASFRREISQKEKALQHQMKKIVSPIIKEYFADAMTCIEKAQTKGDLKSCDGRFVMELSDLLQPGPKPTVESEWFYASPEKKRMIEKESREKATEADKQRYREKMRRYL